MKRALFVTLAALLVFLPSAAAHKGTGGKGYLSTISGLKPNVLGVFVNIIGGDDQLRLSNYSRKTVVVLGYDDEPYLRFRGASVYVNTRSPAFELNKFRYPPEKAEVVATQPLWRKVSNSPTYAWHDHRIHWPKKTPPPMVERAPDQVHKVFDWRVPARANGKPFVIRGFLGYAPPPQSADDGRSGWVVPAVAGGLTAALAAALAVAVGARRRLRRAP
jgi:hypothetical protein